MLRANAGSEFLRDRLHQGVNSVGCLATASLAPTANAQTARLQDSARKQAAIEAKQQYVGPSRCYQDLLVHKADDEGSDPSPRAFHGEFPPGVIGTTKRP
jgi:hypothetical protein